jgi:hypothetical protein
MPNNTPCVTACSRDLSPRRRLSRLNSAPPTALPPVVGGTADGGRRAFLLINNECRVWPRLGSLLGHKGGISATRLCRELHLAPGAQGHDRGILAKIDIPAELSHFSHRPASVYLPPAFFTDARSELPVMLMLAGTPGAPDQWVTSGGAIAVADAYALRPLCTGSFRSAQGRVHARPGFWWPGPGFVCVRPKARAPSRPCPTTRPRSYSRHGTTSASRTRAWQATPSHQHHHEPRLSALCRPRHRTACPPQPEFAAAWPRRPVPAGEQIGSPTAHDAFPPPAPVADHPMTG